MCVYIPQKTKQNVAPLQPEDKRAGHDICQVSDSLRLIYKIELRVINIYF